MPFARFETARFESREGHWRSSLSMAFAALVIGYALYAVSRPATEWFLLWHFPLSPAAIPKQVLWWLGPAPSFLHTFAFAILVALAVGGDGRRRFIACLAWCALEIAAELAQLAAVGLWVEVHSPTAMNLSVVRSVLAGTFSGADLAAVLIGAVLATAYVSTSKR